MPVTDSPRDAVQRLFERCVVRVAVGGQHAGTGFFVAPGKVLTCAHVVEGSSEVSVHWEGAAAPLEAIVSRMLPAGGAAAPHRYPDLALLTVPCRDHPCVRLDEAEPSLGPPADGLRALGFTEVLHLGRSGLTPVTCVYEGPYQDADGPRLQVKGGQVMRGMSGAPLLSERTWRVVGIITTTRDNTDDRGGWATPVFRFWDLEPGLRREHDTFHAQDATWRRACLDQLLGDDLGAAWEPLPAVGGPARLLRPEYAVVPFRGRDRELEEAERWCLDPKASPLRLFVGLAGSGKTRLAVQLCRRLEERGWVCRFLREGAAEGVLESMAIAGGPALIVIDYAETRARRGQGPVGAASGASLQELLEPLTRLGTETWIRILLLARSEVDWWSELGRQASRELRAILAQSAIRHLGPVDEEPGNRLIAYREAVSAFA
ncbi:MAG TPA: trypsin-like peptidase domain-containing protein, partial [Candidatus Dormibacteraeota bacterium]|nr:trypsin-like peptidase domain-containing protein [Candidatus Dormibacteraeota bacterium]